MDTEEMKEKLQLKFNWSTLLENLPGILVVAGGLVVLDKIIDLGAKLEPMYKRVKEWNKDGVFEIIDTVGDNIQLVDFILKAFKVELSGDQLDKLADSLQGLGTAGKYIVKLWELIAPTVRKSRGSGGGKGRSTYKEM